MWTRTLLKTNAKQVLSRNYWMALLVCLIASLLAGGARSAVPTLSLKFSNRFLPYRYGNFYGFSEYSIFGALVAVFLGFTALFLLFAILFTVFVGGPVRVGKCRYFMESRVGDAPFTTVFSVFSGPAYRNVVKVMFMKNLYIFLWSLLFVIPGIYKGYQYSMVDYLLAENPYMSYQRALDLSRQMTEGEKMNIFILDISFFGWLFLGGIIFAFGVIFVNPYIEATYGELYAALRAKAFSMEVTGEDELSGFLRY